MSKTLPHHLVAEQSVLGAVFLDPKKIVHVMDKLTIEDFFDLNELLQF